MDSTRKRSHPEPGEASQRKRRAPASNRRNAEERAHEPVDEGDIEERAYEPVDNEADVGSAISGRKGGKRAPKGRGNALPRDKAMLAKAAVGGEDAMLASTAFGAAYLKNFERFKDEDRELTYGSVSNEELFEMLKFPESIHWGRGDQQALERNWETDPLRTAIMRLTNNTAKDMRLLWKLCVQHFRCPPNDVVSEENHLAIDNKARRTFKEFPDSPIWSEPFCDGFRKIMFHQLWNNGHVPTLVMVLQFAVIVRTDDRRTWPLENPTDSRFIDNLIDEIKADEELDPPQRRKTVQLCRAANKNLKSRVTSLYYSLFMAIVKNCKLEKYDRTIWDQSFEERPYLLTLADLKTIATALDSLGLWGGASLSSQELNLAYSTREDYRGTAPSKWDEFLKALCRYVLLRRARREIRRRTAAAAPVVSGSCHSSTAAPPGPRAASGLSPRYSPRSDPSPAHIDDSITYSDHSVAHNDHSPPPLTPSGHPGVAEDEEGLEKWWEHRPEMESRIWNPGFKHFFNRYM